MGHNNDLRQELPGILRMKTISNVVHPVTTLNDVKTPNAVDAERKTKEKRYIRGMMAQPYNINSRNK
mgnify:CR=1 FL=1